MGGFDAENKPLVHEGWDDLRQKKRSSTDCLFFIAIIACWGAMTLLGFVAIGIIQDDHLPSGNPARLINAVDYKGRVCGVSSDVQSKPYGYYLLDKTAVCVKSCPSEADYTNFVCQDDYQDAADASAAQGYIYVGENKCMYQIKTTEQFNRCVATTSSSSATAAAQSAASLNGVTLTDDIAYSSLLDDSWFSNFLSDIYNNMGLVFGFGIGVATVISFAYLYLMRIPGLLFLTIWGIILSIQAVLVIGSFLLWDLASTWSTDGIHSSNEWYIMKILSYIGMGVSFLFFCVIIVLRSRVQLAIGVTKEAAKALASIPMLIILPIIQAVGITAFLVPWIIYVLYLASSGELVTQTGTYTVNSVTTAYTYRTFEYTTNTKYAFLYMLFCWFWTSEFIIALGQLIIALSISAWYFARDKSTTGNSTFAWALKTIGRYHIGTAAFGSLVIAVIKTIRAVIAYLQNKARKSKNKLLQYTLACLQCCMWCLEKCMKFINKNAYITTAIYGKSFCPAAATTFYLLLRNILRVAAVNMVASFVLFIGKFFSPSLTVFILYLILGYDPTISDGINDIVSVLVFVWIISYFVASMFAEIFGMSIETILCCYIADEEMFAPENRHADGALKSTMHTTAKSASDMKIAPEADSNEGESAENQRVDDSMQKKPVGAIATGTGPALL